MFSDLKDEKGSKYMTKNEVYDKQECDNQFQTKIKGFTGDFKTADGKTVLVSNGLIIWVNNP